MAVTLSGMGLCLNLLLSSIHTEVIFFTPAVCQGVSISKQHVLGPQPDCGLEGKVQRSMRRKEHVTTAAQRREEDIPRRR